MLKEHSVILPVNTSPDILSYRYTSTSANLEAPIEKGDKLSSVEVWYGSICIAETDLYAMNKVSVIQSLDDTQLVDNEKNSWPDYLIVAVIVLIVSIGVFGGIWGIRYLRRMVSDKRSRRYRQNRRRSR